MEKHGYKLQNKYWLFKTQVNQIENINKHLF